MELLSRNFSRRAAAKSILTASTVGVAAVTAANAAQPHMQAALTHLNTAAAQLQQAADDKAGHREKAIQLVSQAINQVQQGIAAGAGK